MRAKSQKYTYDGFDRLAKHTAGTGGTAKTTSYIYDAFDRTTSETTSGTTGKTTAFTYLGMDSQVLREEVAGQATKSYQWSPWGQQLTQIKHNTDGTREYSHYLYHPKGDVEAVTKPDGTTRATYGYTAYGSDDANQFTGTDTPDPQNPDAEPYNAYRYNGHRWDAASSTYDTGFRNYDPGLNRFLTRDMYTGAMADMTLATDPYTNNRYAFAGGNPISFIELDGHFFGISSDIGHAILDVAGQVPVIGEVADGANAIWYAAEGNWVDAGLSAAGMIPGAGSAITGARLAKKGLNAADAISDSTKAAKGAKGAKGGKGGGGGGKPKTDAKAEPKKKDSEGGGACPTNSFIPGTKVVMADGTTKNIEDLKTGEYVLATDPETGDLQGRKVTDTRNDKGDKHLVTLTVDTDGKNGHKTAKITSTAGHPYWLPDYGTWTDAGDLKPGMWLQTAAGTWVQITAVDEAHRTERVYNLTVDGVHTYYVLAGTQNLLVHNEGCGPGGPDDAELARQRADELQAQRNDYPYADQNGTTAVIGVRNARTGDLSIRVGINGDGAQPASWTFRNGEDFVQAPGHAEQGIINSLGRDEFVEFGGTSRNICSGTCFPMLNTRGIRFGGNFPGRADKTPFRLFWSVADELLE